MRLIKEKVSVGTHRTDDLLAELCDQLSPEFVGVLLHLAGIRELDNPLQEGDEIQILER